MKLSSIKAPDYRQLKNWAASPHKPSPSDLVPSFLSEEDFNKTADVFFIHPTTYLCQRHGRCSIMLDRTEVNRMRARANDEPWNSDTDDTALNAFTDQGTIRMQASAFNRCARVFAPRYRQAHVKTFFLKPSDAVQAAFDMAYSDIRNAFSYYLEHENNGRPVIIAGHSQGSFHGLRLLREFFDGTSLQRQLVCAYLPGFQIPHNHFRQLPFANTPEMTGGYLGWRSYQRGTVPEDLPAERGDSLCVNPFIWNDTIFKISLGKKEYGIEDCTHVMPQGMAATIEPRTGVLLVDLPDTAPEKMKRHQNLHLYDYSLFWLCIRENAALRVQRFIEKQ